jgi:hypothetical protein
VPPHPGQQPEPPPPGPPAYDPVPYTTIAAVVAEMTRRWQALRRRGDWGAVFAETYLRTTENILAASAQAGAFENPAWLVQLDCAFAHRYFVAHDCWTQSTECPPPWKLAFQAAREKRTLVIQDLLLGMSAHINYDLPYALDATVPPDLPPDQLDSYWRDHNRMNALLAATVDVVQQAASEYDPLLRVVDDLGPDDELGTGQLIDIWRARSWAYFLLLRRAADRAIAEQMIAQSAGEYALLLLQVQRTIPQAYWPNRLYRDTVGWLRRWRV